MPAPGYTSRPGLVRRTAAIGSARLPGRGLLLRLRGRLLRRLPGRLLRGLFGGLADAPAGRLRAAALATLLLQAALEQLGEIDDVGGRTLRRPLVLFLLAVHDLLRAHPAF